MACIPWNRVGHSLSESDRPEQAKTSSPVPITEKDPLERVFFFGVISNILLCRFVRLSTTRSVYPNSQKNQKKIQPHKTPPIKEGSSEIYFSRRKGIILILLSISIYFRGSHSWEWEFLIFNPIFMGKLLIWLCLFFGIEPVVFLRKVTGRTRRKLLRKYR